VAVGQLHLLQAGQEGLHLGLDGLFQQPTRPGPQHRGQRVVNFLGLTKTDDGAIVVHGVSLLREVLAGSSPTSVRHPPHCVITQFPA
jgi:hypothetical protein